MILLILYIILRKKFLKTKKNLPKAVYPKALSNQMRPKINSLVSTRNYSSSECKITKYLSDPKPQLLKFQYLDKQDIITLRFAIINYIPDLINPTEIDKILPLIQKYVQKRYLPYYNTRSDLSKTILLKNKQIYLFLIILLFRYFY